MNMRHHAHWRLTLVLGLALSLGSGPGAVESAQHARDHHHSRVWHHHEADHDRARQALARGEVLPITEVLHRVGEQIPGDLLELEFEQEDDRGRRRWIYEIKILSPDGHIREFEVDAATAELLKVEDDD